VQKLAATTTFFAIPSADQMITNSTVLDIAKKKASLDKNNAHKKDRETLDSAFERGIDSNKILPLS